MSVADDIARIAAQERQLVFSAFDEATAFSIGLALRERALAEKMPIVIHISVWDRLLFFAALPGSTSSNADWVRRKVNAVKMFHRSTFRLFLEQERPDQTFNPASGMSPQDYVAAGGGFPVTIKGVGVVGAFCVSGLPQRDDHALVVEVLCDHLGIPRADLVLHVGNV